MFLAWFCDSKLNGFILTRKLAKIVFNFKGRVNSGTNYDSPG